MTKSKVNYFEELTKLMEEYPDLVFDNHGYENIPEQVREASIKGHDKVEAILKERVTGFVEFQNFKPRSDGTVAVRCQTYWNESFIGVSYFSMENFKPENAS